MLRYVMICYVMICYVMLCCVVSCHVMLCCVMLCYVMVYDVWLPTLFLLFFSLHTFFTFSCSQCYLYTTHAFSFILSICRAAFLRLETESNTELLKLRSMLLEASKHLEGYEKMEELENEIDDDLFSKISIKGGKINDIEMMKNEVARQMDTTSLLNNNENHFYEIVKRIPSRTLEEKVRKRKILVLFQTLNRDFTLSKNELESSRKELEILKIDLERVHQPKQYLIAKLRDEEDLRKESTARRMVCYVMLCDAMLCHVMCYDMT